MLGFIGGLLDFLGMLIFVGLTLKIISISNAVRWIFRYGRAHADYIDAIERKTRKPALEQEILKSFQVNSGGFLPFGAKDYRLRDAIARVKIRFIRMFLDLVRKTFFSYPRLIILAPFYALSMTILIKYSLAPPLHLIGPNFLYFLSIASLIVSIPLLIEHVVGFFVFDNYHRYFHMMDFQELDPDLSKLWQLFALGFTATSIVFVGFSAVFVTLALFNGFNYDGERKILFEIFVWRDLIHLLLYCLYFTVTTISTTGYGDIHAINGYGMLISILLLVLTFFLVTFVFAVFWAKVGDGDGVSVSGVTVDTTAVDVAILDSRIVVTFSDGRELAVPLTQFPRLADATVAQRQNWRLIGRGHGIRWPDVDEDISVASLLRAG
jgi:Protein of unknown function (DUF2442)/Ion channel